MIHMMDLEGGKADNNDDGRPHRRQGREDGLPRRLQGPPQGAKCEEGNFKGWPSVHPMSMS